MNSKNLSLVALVLIAIAVYLGEQGIVPGWPPTGAATQTQGQAASDDGLARIAEAYRAQRSDVQVAGSGVVKKVLSDDLQGSRHQRFLLRLANGQTLLVAHNIDLAPRIDGLREGDTVGFFGEYEWNNQGGVLHWTHHDPAGRHPDGWHEHEGRRYR